ncbi:MAG: hypothetical protein AB7V25_16760 [Mangrovibacterium sp.]
MDNYQHSFHIPVMGLAYTVDTPVKVAHLGISSVISIVDDFLMEKMREFYSRKMDMPFREIPVKVDDFRAKRITEYLNLIDRIVSQKYEQMVETFHQKESEFQKYLNLLPNAATLRERFNQALQQKSLSEVKNWIRSNFKPGSIDVNIMTKLDKVNYRNNEPLPTEYNDAHAALRGFANSTLSSSLVLSAGMNPRLYSYLENFEDFYPDTEGKLKKKIILKVSDYRSALIQGRMLAKKGIWVSEYRVESGLNCGGHAFASQGYLLGPILHEFAEKRQELTETVIPVYLEALKEKGKNQSLKPELKVTAQGGVGTNEEHTFLLSEYKLDSIGWGTPFLLVPEVCNIDTESLELLRKAGEEDVYLSEASPLGVPFNNVRNSSQQKQINEFIAAGKPGFPCTKRYLTFNTEYTERPICTASTRFLKTKIAEIEAGDLSEEEKKKEIALCLEKECLCEGLTNPAYLANGIEPDFKRSGVSICPGPNIAYFDQVVSLEKMIGHIYGKINLLSRLKRPNLFIKELGMYTEYLEKKLSRFDHATDKKQLSYYRTFRDNMKEGIVYYRQLFKRCEENLCEMAKDVFNQLDHFELKLESFHI